MHEPPSEPFARNNRVLVIDDNPAIHADVRKILCPQVSEAAASLDALEAELLGEAPAPARPTASFAVDSAHQKQGLGSALLKDALLRTIAAAQIAGIRAVLLHAMSDDAKRFYERAGFYECPVDPMMMMITLAEVEKNVSPPSAS